MQDSDGHCAYVGVLWCSLGLMDREVYFGGCAWRQHHGRRTPDNDVRAGLELHVGTQQVDIKVFYQLPEPLSHHCLCMQLYLSGVVADILDGWLLRGAIG